MKKVNSPNSSCRHCRFYRPEGRRGGVCQKLSVPVDSNWKACVLACSPFPNSFKKLEEIVHLETAFSLKYANNSKITVNHKSNTSIGYTEACPRLPSNGGMGENPAPLSVKEIVRTTPNKVS